jgi:hypothetical protein
MKNCWNPRETDREELSSSCVDATRLREERAKRSRKLSVFAPQNKEREEIIESNPERMKKRVMRE